MNEALRVGRLADGTEIPRPLLVDDVGIVQQHYGRVVLYTDVAVDEMLPQRLRPHAGRFQIFKINHQHILILNMKMEIVNKRNTMNHRL